MIQTQENGEKLHFSTTLGPLGQNSCHQFFFSKNLASSGTTYLGQLSSCIISGKTNDLILRKFSDRQTEESDFIGQCPTSIKHPTVFSFIQK